MSFKYFFILFFISILPFHKAFAQFPAVEPLPDTIWGLGNNTTWCDRTFGNDSADRCYVVRETIGKRTMLAGTSWSKQGNELTSANYGEGDFWVLQVDTLGRNIIWNKTYGGSGTDSLFAMEGTYDGNFIIGGASNSGIGGAKTQDSLGGYDFWVLKINQNGAVWWDKTFGGDSTDVLKSIVPCNDMGFLLAGYSISDTNSSKTDSCRGGYDYWVVKIDATGNVLWQKTYGGNKNDYLNSAIFTFDHGFVLSGWSESNTSSEKSENSRGVYDYWVIKIDSTGNIQWDKTIGSSLNDFAYKVVQDADTSGYVIGGTSWSPAASEKTQASRGQCDFWVVKIANDGSMLWDKTIGSNRMDDLRDIYLTAEGNYVFAGSSNSNIGNEKSENTKGNFDYWIVKMDTLRNIHWDNCYGGTSNDLLQSVYQSCDRGYILAGWSFSNIGSDKSQNSRGFEDYWALKLNVPTDPHFGYDGVCLGQTTNFIDFTQTYPDAWNWDFGDNNPLVENHATDKNPVHSYSSPGDYLVTMIVKEGCQLPDTLSKIVTIKPNVVLGKVNAGEDRCIEEGQSISLSAGDDVPNGSTFLWSPNGETTRSIRVDETGTYRIVATAANGCSEEDRVIVADCPQIYIPNAFTPNNDGVNDVFYVYGVGITKIDTYIYNRWGENIFHSESLSEGWDGTYHGYKSPLEVYVYLVIYSGIGVSNERKIGRVALIR